MSSARFEPSPWWRSAHVQTIAAALPLWAPPRRFAPGTRETLRVSVGGEGAVVAHAWWTGADRAEQVGTPRPAVVLVHGVGGTSESRYMLRAAVGFHRAGLHVVRMNMRGAGEGIDAAPSLYHAGLTSDVEEVARAVGADPRVSRVVVVGFSLGGNVALKLAGEIGARPAHAPASPVAAVVSMSAPLDLAVVSRLIERWPNLPYKAYILRNLIAQARAFAARHPERATYDAGRARFLTSIRGYDDLVIAPMHGFRDVDDYYEQTSARHFVRAIRMPTLVLHADDDPIVPGHTVRPHLASLPSSAEVAFTARGGHVAWVGGFSEDHFVQTWGVRRAIDFVTEQTVR